MAECLIADYGLLSNGQSATLVHRHGSIDWYCPGRFDAPSIFARLLDPHAGHWQIQPVGPFTTKRAYLGGTMVLQTTFMTAHGTVLVTDGMALEMDVQGHDIGKHSPPRLVRQLYGVQGRVEVHVEICPRPAYGLAVPLLQQRQECIVIQAGSLELILMSTRPLQVEMGKATATFMMAEGETVSFALSDRVYRDDNKPLPPVDVAKELANARAGWQSWADLHVGYQGLYQEQVRRSALVLQALTFQPNGAVIAAATTSLPESLGGASNWDYRFVWLRDLAFTMRALWIAACPDESKRFFGWILRALGDLAAPQQPVQIVYGIEGERDLTERTLPGLAGFGDSQPVRIGNDAWRQKQLDVLGEVVDAIYLLRDQLDFHSAMEGTAGSIGQLVVQLANRAATSWQEPDAGMWEARDQERHYLTSKVICWVALDRAIKLAPQLELSEGRELEHWQRVRAEIHVAVLEKGWNEQIHAFTGAFGSDQLDASVLLLPLVEFLPATDPRMAATIRTVARELTTNGLVRRWAEEKNGFLLCTYWLVECLALLGEVEQAQQLFEQTTAYANDLGLLAEMVEPHTGELLGNFPQAFSHIGLVNAAWRLSTEAAKQVETPQRGYQKQEGS
jgi:GH15 family glucan-1,4-alpha-glucosidase